MRDPVELAAIAIPILAEAIAVTLIIACAFIWFVIATVTVLV
jgi:hypothetical protein